MPASKEYSDILQKIKEAFAEELLLSPYEIGDDADFVNDLGGDSLASLGVFTKLEEEYGVLLTDEEYLSCRTASEAAAMLLKKLNGESTASEKTAQENARRIDRFTDSREWEMLSARLKEAEAVGNPYFVAHDSPLFDTSIVNGREVINYGSYNYVCLSGHPRTIAAAKAAAEKYGTSASGSRLLAGEKTLHRELEAEIAKWKHTEDAVVMVSGHATNVTVVGCFCNAHDLILYDALSHNSIAQGCKLSEATAKAFPHNDFAALEGILAKNRDKYEKVLLVVEGVYSMDGDIAPIDRFVALKKKYGCFLMVDEAHSACVIGETGRGVDEYFHLAPEDIDLKMGTLSKGLGTCGGYIAGKKELVTFLRYYAPGFVFSVGLSPVLAAASLEGLKVLQEDPSIVQSLQKNIRDFVETAHEYGFDTCLAKETAIVPVLIGDDITAYALSDLMLKQGVFVPPAVYPAVPHNQARLRFCLTSRHKSEQAKTAFALLDKLIRENGFNVPRTK